MLHRFNIQYGRVGSSDADIVSAARNADIHERILTFPEAYETEVSPPKYFHMCLLATNIPCFDEHLSTIWGENKTVLGKRSKFIINIEKLIT